MAISFSSIFPSISYGTLLVSMVYNLHINMRRKVQLIISGGIRTGANVAKALAMGADAVSIDQRVLLALGCNRETYFQDGEH